MAAPERILSSFWKRYMPEMEFPYKRKGQIFVFHGKGTPATNVIALEQGKLAYVPIPKNACTSLKLLFFRLIHGCEFGGHFDAIHHQFDYRASDFNAFKADKSYFKFTVIRDPVERFFSAYNSRVLVHRELSENWFLQRAPKFDEGFNYMKSRSLTFDPTIAEFIQRLEDYIEVSTILKHHFVPQTLFFFRRPEVFDKIYDITQLPELEKDLSERLGQPIQLGNVQETKSLTSAVRLSDIGMKDLGKVIRFYVTDYEKLSKYLQ